MPKYFPILILLFKKLFINELQIEFEDRQNLATFGRVIPLFQLGIWHFGIHYHFFIPNYFWIVILFCMKLIINHPQIEFKYPENPNILGRVILLFWRKIGLFRIRYHFIPIMSIFIADTCIMNTRWAFWSSCLMQKRWIKKVERNFNLIMLYYSMAELVIQNKWREVTLYKNSPCNQLIARLPHTCNINLHSQNHLFWQRFLK